MVRGYVACLDAFGSQCGDFEAAMEVRGLQKRDLRCENSMVSLVKTVSLAFQRNSACGGRGEVEVHGCK